MDHFTSTETEQPWWADVAHLRGDGDRPVAATVTAPAADDPFLIAERPRTRERVASQRPARAERTASERTGRAERSTTERPARSGGHARSRTSSRNRRPERTGTDWFAQEAGTAGRRTTPRQSPTRPERPRVTLVDVSPDHAMLSRAQQVRRAPGERPTVTITGRPEAALPPRVSEPKHRRARRTREQASSLVASPDRMILWAVALGLLMILASIGTASADAATTLTLLP